MRGFRSGFDLGCRPIPACFQNLLPALALCAAASQPWTTNSMQLPRSVQLPAPAFVWLPARSAPARSAQLLVGSVWLLRALCLLGRLHSGDLKRHCPTSLRRIEEARPTSSWRIEGPARLHSRELQRHCPTSAQRIEASQVTPGPHLM